MRRDSRQKLAEKGESCYEAINRANDQVKQRAVQKMMLLIYDDSWQY